MRLANLLTTVILALSATAKHGEGDDGDDDDHSQSTSSTTAISPATSISQPPPSQTSTGTTSLTSSLTATTTTSSAPTTVPTNALQFPPPSNVTTCENTTITWEFASFAHVPVTILVSNENLSANNDGKGLEPVISRTLSTTVDAVTCEVAWPAVNVPPGQYNAIAFDTARNMSLSASSPPFFVTEGSNTTCLNSTSTSADSSSDVSSPAVPSDSKTLSSGALVGTIAGVVVGVIGLVVVFTLPRLRQRRRTTAPRPGAPYQTF